MAVMRFLLWLYPRRFRARFEKEMLQTFSAADADRRLQGSPAHGCFLVREILGAVKGLLVELACQQQFESNAQRLMALGLAIALQAVLYSALLPIGPRAAATTGRWLLYIGLCGLLLAALVNLPCAFVHRSQLHLEDE